MDTLGYLDRDMPGPIGGTPAPCGHCYHTAPDPDCHAVAWERKTVAKCCRCGRYHRNRAWPSR